MEKNEIKTNCPNCGAPLNEDGKCDYCQTKSTPVRKSEIVIDQNGIRITYC